MIIGLDLNDRDMLVGLIIKDGQGGGCLFGAKLTLRRTIKKQGGLVKFFSWLVKILAD